MPGKSSGSPNAVLQAAAAHSTSHTARVDSRLARQMIDGIRDHCNRPKVFDLVRFGFSARFEKLHKLVFTRNPFTSFVVACFFFFTEVVCSRLSVLMVNRPSSLIDAHHLQVSKSDQFSFRNGGRGLP